MADKKISALTGASTPLAGTEVLPIVQSGATVKVSVANLTAGRAVSMAGGSFTDNITQSTAAKGVNFTANTPATGMTSQLLNWYEEGAYTPTVTCSVSGTITPATTADSLSYTRIGRIVSIYGNITIQTVSSPNGIILLTLPFTVANLSEYQSQSGMPMSISGCVAASTNSFVAVFEKNSSSMKIFNGSANSLAATAANELQAGAEMWFSVSYVAA